MTPLHRLVALGALLLGTAGCAPAPPAGPVGRPADDHVPADHKVPTAGGDPPSPAAGARDDKPAGFVGVRPARVDGRMRVKGLTVGSPAQLAGLRLGDRLLGVGPTRAGIVDAEGKTDDEVIGLMGGKAGDAVWLRYRRGDAGPPVEVELTRRPRFDDEKMLAVTWARTGNVTFVPRELVERFPGSPRTYEYVGNQSQLLAFPDRYTGKRVAVLADLLFPKVAADRVEMRLFTSFDSPVGLVTRAAAPLFFERVVHNDPAENRFVVLHVRLRPQRDPPGLAGEVEEVVFLNDGAPDLYRPLIVDQIQPGWEPR